MLVFLASCDSLPRKERAGRMAHRQLGLSVCIGMRARPSRFSVASRETSRTLLFGWSFPIGNDSLPRSVGVFLSLFCFFSPLDTSELDFVFSADDEFLVLSLFGILLYFEATGDFAMLC
jgi:hypothetical protein